MKKIAILGILALSACAHGAGTQNMRVGAGHMASSHDDGTRWPNVLVTTFPETYNCKTHAEGWTAMADLRGQSNPDQSGGECSGNQR